MKPNIKKRKRTTRNITGIIAITLASYSAYAQQPIESGAGQICGVLRTFQGEIQVFDHTRTHLGDAKFGTKLRCGDWISVDQGKAVIEHVNGAGILVSENSFIQILDPQSGTNPEHAHVALYRGEFLFQAGKGESRVITPNAIGRVEKGGAYVIYSSSSEESQIVGLGGKATLENRFFGEKTMRADFAHLVAFSNPVERLIPEQGRLVNPKELNARLTVLGVDASIMASIEKTVKGASKVRMPVSLARAFREPTPESVIRPIAPLASVKTPSRAPASFRPKAKPVVRRVPSEPDFRLSRVAEEENDRKKLIQSLSMIRPDEE